MKFLLRDNKDRSVLKRKHRPFQLYDDHLNRISISTSFLMFQSIHKSSYKNKVLIALSSYVLRLPYQK